MGVPLLEKKREAGAEVWHRVQRRAGVGGRQSPRHTNHKWDSGERENPPTHVSREVVVVSANPLESQVGGVVVSGRTLLLVFRARVVVV